MKQKQPPPSPLDRELAYYRRECNDLGARLLRLQEEQSQAFREARRSRTVAKLIREAHGLTDAYNLPGEIGEPMLEVMVDNALCDRAAFLERVSPDDPGRFRVTHTIGMGGEAWQSDVVLPAAPGFFFTTSRTLIEPPAYELTSILRTPYVLWAHDPVSGVALILGNHSQGILLGQQLPGAVVHHGLALVVLEALEQQEGRDHPAGLAVALAAGEDGAVRAVVEDHDLEQAKPRGGQQEAEQQQQPGPGGWGGEGERHGAQGAAAEHESQRAGDEAHGRAVGAGLARSRHGGESGEEGLHRRRQAGGHHFPGATGSRRAAEAGRARVKAIASQIHGQLSLLLSRFVDCAGPYMVPKDCAAQDQR